MYNSKPTPPKPANDSIWVQLWIETEKAQLKEYLENWKGKDIKIANMSYKVNDGFINDNGIARIELIGFQVHFVQLSLIYDKYENYSALSKANRLALLDRLDIKI